MTDGTGATATKTIEITVTDPPGNQAPVVEAGATPHVGGVAPVEVLFTAAGR